MDLFCLVLRGDLVLSTVPDTWGAFHRYVLNDKQRAVFAVLPILITSFDSLILLGTETIIFTPADSDNSKLSFQQPSSVLGEHLINLDFSHTLLGRPKRLPSGFQSG